MSLSVNRKLHPVDFVQDSHDYHAHERDMSMPAPLSLFPLVVKLRHICVYRNLSARAGIFLETSSAELLPKDVGLVIVSFLT